MRAWSDEYRRFKLNGKCPQCGNRHLINLVKAFNSWKMFDDQDNQLSSLTPVWKIPLGSYMVCQSCSYRIDIYVGDSPRPSVEILELTETHRSEEPIGREERLIDNSRNTAEVTRRFQVTREWTTSYHLEQERSHSSRAGIQIEDSGLRLSSEVEQGFRQRYSLEESSRKTYEEEVTVTVPAGISLRVFIDWKNIWQHGTFRVRTGESLFSYQFKVTAGVTFDQGQAALPPLPPLPPL